MAPETLVDEHELIPPGAKEVHPPYGFVRLVDVMGDDLAVVNAARVSFNKESEWDVSKVTDFASDEDRDYLENRTLHEGDEKVLRFLLNNKHGTPFEHCVFKFHIRAPIFVFREWHRHRIASINEESARYVPLQPHFYVPDADHIRTQTDKPGRYKFEPLTDELLREREIKALELAGLGVQIDDGYATVDQIMNVFRESYTDAYNSYEALMAVGVAKEVARTVLPVGIYSQMIWSCNARALMNFLNLRNAETALREIREYAVALEGFFAEAMPITHAAFVDNDRRAP